MGSDGVRVGVLGASGYAGGELIRLLHGHRRVELAYLGASASAGKTLAEAHPHLSALPASGGRLGALEPAVVLASGVDVVFCSLANGLSAGLAPALLDAGVKVIDLAGDFRLPAGDFPSWYGFQHPSESWLDRAVYGLPELFRDRVAGADLVANPGCYPTPAVLALGPLLSAGAIEPGGIVVDGKTGLSGAGRTPTEATTFSASEDSVRPYRFPRHQHTPEIERALELASGVATSVSFVPHLVPAVRGVLVTCYARLTGAATTGGLTELLASTYAREPFVRVLPSGEMVDTKRTRGSNVVELQAVADPRTGIAIVAGALDNLVKGAAGQAIQNLNLIAGFRESDGLPLTGAYP